MVVVVADFTMVDAAERLSPLLDVASGYPFPFKPSSAAAAASFSGLCQSSDDISTPSCCCSLVEVVVVVVVVAGSTMVGDVCIRRGGPFPDRLSALISFSNGRARQKKKRKEISNHFH